MAADKKPSSLWPSLTAFNHTGIDFGSSSFRAEESTNLHPAK